MTTSPATGKTRRPYAARVPVDVRRDQLMDAALLILVRDGYDAVSIESIAKEAGVTRPVVYGVFEGLNDLLGTLLDRQQARALGQLTEVLPAGRDLFNPDRMVAETARRLIEVIRADPLTWQPILLPPHGMPEQVRSRIDADRTRVTAQIAGLLEIGLTLRGGPALDAEVLAHAIVGVLEHFGRILLAEPDLFDTDRLVATIVGLLSALK